MIATLSADGVTVFRHTTHRAPTDSGAKLLTHTPPVAALTAAPVAVPAADPAVPLEPLRIGSCFDALASPVSFAASRDDTDGCAGGSM